MKKFFLFAALATATPGTFAASSVPSTYTQAIDAARPLFEKSDYVGAQKLTEQALSLAKTPGEKVDALLHLGLTYRGRKMYPQAREQWVKALQLPGASVQDKLGVQSVIAASYGEQENWTRCAAEFQKIVDAPEATAQDKATARFAIATALVGDKREVEARKQYSVLVSDTSLDPNFRAMVSMQLAQNLLSARHFEQARAAFTEANHLSNAPGELPVAAQAGIAETFKAQGNAPQAQSEFVKAQIEALKQSQIFNNQKQFASARALKEQALVMGEVEPMLDAATRAQIGELWLLEGKPGEARSSLEAFVQKDYGAALPEKEATSVRVVKQAAQITIARSFIQEGNKAQAQKVLQTLLASENLDSNVKFAAETVLQGLS